MLKPHEYRFFKFTYRDNHLIPAKIKADIERRSAIDANYKRVYADGEIGSREGLVFQDWEIVDFMPESSKRRIGGDFGFTNDPTACYDVRLHEGCIWIDELCYETGMSNKAIAKVVLPMGKVKAVFDNSEMKSIEDLKTMGVNAHPCVKGPGSVSIGLEKMQSYPIKVTRRSVGIIKELRNYRWDTDKNGKSLNEPIDSWNHGIDAVRYAVTDLTTIKEIKPSRVHFSFGK
jgi:phage terminase large subunit